MTTPKTPRWVSPLRYPGGKVRMTAWLAEVFTHLRSPMDIEVWIEPFGGGAGAALMALTAHDVPEAWIVEANPALAAFWTTIMSDDGRLAARVERTNPTLAAFMDAREAVAAALAGEAVDREDLAFAAFLLNRCSRSGMVLPNVGPMGGKAQAGRFTIGSRFNAEGAAARIRAVSALGDRFRPQEGDGIAYIEALTGSGIEDEVFAFVDPPYVGVGNSLYAVGMDAGMHERLAAALRACPAPWVLTYDTHPAVLDLYKGHQVVEFAIPHTANQQGVGTEYLVTSAGLRVPEVNPLGRGAWKRMQAETPELNARESAWA